MHLFAFIKLFSSKPIIPKIIFDKVIKKDSFTETQARSRWHNILTKRMQTIKRAKSCYIVLRVKIWYLNWNFPPVRAHAWRELWTLNFPWILRYKRGQIHQLRKIKKIKYTWQNSVSLLYIHVTWALNSIDKPISSSSVWNEWFLIETTIPGLLMKCSNRYQLAVYSETMYILTYIFIFAIPHQMRISAITNLLLSQCKVVPLNYIEKEKSFQRKFTRGSIFYHA